MLPGLQSSVALWRLQLASELLFVGDASATDAGRASRRQGIEWNNHYIDSKNLLLGMDVSLSCARFTDSDPAGDWIPGSVETVVSAGATLRDLGPWSTSLQVRRFEPRALVEDNSARSKATTLIYGRIGYRFGSRWTLDLDVFNILDRKASDIDYLDTSRLRGSPLRASRTSISIPSSRALSASRSAGASEHAVHA